MDSPPIPFLAGKKIIVVGAGIAGLSFVLSLRKQWASLPPSLSPPSITLYERDNKDAGVGREGYSISIRSDGHGQGMQTLNKLGLLDSMLAASVTGIQANPGAFVLWDRDWKEIIRVKQATPNGLPEPGMRIARNVLRRRLIDALSAKDQVHWGTACTGAAQLRNGRVSVQLSNGKLEECDLIIAADGSRSKIRSSLRPDDVLHFAGATCIMGNARFPSGVPAPMDRDWGMYLSGSGTGLFVSPIDEHSAVWSLSYLSPSPSPRETIKPPFSTAEARTLLSEALERGSSFKEPFSTLVKATDVSTLGILDTMDKPPIADFPSSIVFIGDANHAISPFAGNGANMALMDGWELAERFCACGALEEALAQFNKTMLPRTRSVLRFSRWSIRMAHARGWWMEVVILAFKVLNWLWFRSGRSVDLERKER